MNKRDQKQKLTLGKIIALVVALIAMEPEILILFLAITPIGLAGYLVYLYAKKRQGTSRTGKVTYTSRAKFDDCPQPLFCFHKDKGEHHVRSGKEIDPWDRPDIDISKYQRRQ